VVYIALRNQTMSLISQNNFLTVKEVSELLKLSVLTIYKYIRERKFEVVEFGGHYRIEKLSLDKFIDSHKISKGEI
jgi:excisionase family DNA binding protein